MELLFLIPLYFVSWCIGVLIEVYARSRFLGFFGAGLTFLAGIGIIVLTPIIIVIIIGKKILLTAIQVLTFVAKVTA